MSTDCEECQLESWKPGWLVRWIIGWRGSRTCPRHAAKREGEDRRWQQRQEGQVSIRCVKHGCDASRWAYHPTPVNFDGTWLKTSVGWLCASHAREALAFAEVVGAVREEGSRESR